MSQTLTSGIREFSEEQAGGQVGKLVSATVEVRMGAV